MRQFLRSFEANSGSIQHKSAGLPICTAEGCLEEVGYRDASHEQEYKK
jgi:hypothetical protein